MVKMKIKNILLSKMIDVFLIFLINILLFISFFIILEISCRFYNDGWKALENIMKYSDTPYSNLGTGNWVVYDKLLGFKLNSKAQTATKFYIGEDEVLLHKSKNVYRIIFLGDSIPFDNPGFVEYIGKHLSKHGNIEIIKACVPGYGAWQELQF